MRKPWFRKSDGWWYLTVIEAGKRRHERLSQDPDEAIDLWHKWESTPAPETPNAMLVSILDAFLDWCEHNQAEATYQWHKLYLSSFCRRFGRLGSMELKPLHVTQWLKAEKFTDGARRAAITSLKRSLNWACQEGMIAVNPIAAVKRPQSGRREQIVDTAMAKRILEAADGPFVLFLQAMRFSGCRPKEVRTVEAQNADIAAEVWARVKNKTGAKTGLNRTIYTGDACLLTITRILAYHRPHGALFRNSDGKPWTANAIRCRMRQLREKLKLPAGVVAYSFRHTYITEALIAGVDASTVAELVGTSVEMIHRHYGHLDQKGDHLRRAAKRASSRPSASGSAETGQASAG